MPAGELGTITTGLYVEALARGAGADARAGGVYVDALTRVTPAVLAAGGVYVEALTTPPSSGFTGWGIPA